MVDLKLLLYYGWKKSLRKKHGGSNIQHTIIAKGKYYSFHLYKISYVQENNITTTFILRYSIISYIFFFCEKTKYTN